MLSVADRPCGVISSVLGSDGSGGELLIMPAGGSRCPTSHESVSNGDHFAKMNGNEVFRFATLIVPKATEQVVQKAGWKMTDVSLLIPHQANSRIIASAAKRLAIPPERLFVNVDRYGNTSAASIPIALCEAIEARRVEAGDKLVLVGFGAGLTWAAAAIEWGLPVPTKPQPWLRRSLASARFGWAAVRSPGLRLARHAYNTALGPEGGDNWRGHMRKRVDGWLSRHTKPRG